MFCSNCGSQQKDAAKFCTECGAPLAQDTPTGTVIDPVRPVSVGRDEVKGGPGRAGGRGVMVAAVVLVVLAVAAVVTVAALLTDGFGLLQPADKTTVATSVQTQETGVQEEAQAEPDAAPQPEPAAPVVRDSVEEYSWDELSQVSALISAAATDEEARQIAADYHLCNADGTLDGSQTKQLTLGDGTSVTMQVAGFNHDDRVDGSGRAGITFISRGIVGSHAMNADDATAGGWRDSDLRAWMNGELLGLLPDDLVDVIVPVSKLTNTVGETADTSAVSATTDTLWTLSYAEIGGHMDIDDGGYDEVYNAEGDQYQLFSDLGVRWDSPNDCLAIPGVERWWERSPDPMDGRYFMCVGEEGTPWYAHMASNEFGIVMCFCV